MTLAVVWFKRDLRAGDHAPLAAAAKAGGRVLPLYVVEPEYWQLADVSRRHWHFIHDSLALLRVELAALGAPLVVRVGEIVSVLESIRSSAGKFTLYSHEETGNGWTYARDKRVRIWCRSHDISWLEFPSHGVVRKLATRDSWQAQRDARMQQPLVAPPTSLTPTTLEAGMLPDKQDAMFGRLDIGHVQQGGREQGQQVLASFLKERARRYTATISKPGVSARHCSRLSAHIAYGTLSVREIEQQTKSKLASLRGLSDPDATYMARGLRAFLSRLAWRCHFVQKLEQQPALETHCMHPAFEGLRELHGNEAWLEAWIHGRTGYPLVDACMRSLHDNGWITFRMRAMLVSFASYHLWLDWRQTAPLLARLFTDYEPGIHYSQFQMQSGVTGINTVRIYNPIKQSLEQDPQGKFIRRYVPELEAAAQSFIHEPWRMETPPAGYPAPIVPHEAAVKEARAKLSRAWSSPEFQEQARAVYQRLGSRARPPSRRKPQRSAPQMELPL